MKPGHYKYVILKNGEVKIFEDYKSHDKEAGTSIENIESAGFVNIFDDFFNTSGKSISLGIGRAPEDKEKLSKAIGKPYGGFSW